TLRNAEKKTFLDMGVEAVPLYNLTFGPSPGKHWHHKGIGYGYVLSFGDRRDYLSEYTECGPEVNALNDIALAFVATNSPGRMSSGLILRATTSWPHTRNSTPAFCSFWIISRLGLSWPSVSRRCASLFRIICQPSPRWWIMTTIFRCSGGTPYFARVFT